MRYHCVLQQDIADCGPACLATILEHYKKKVSLTVIRELAGTDLQGTNAYGLIKTAQSFQLKTCLVKGKKEQLTEEIPLPCIADVIADDQLSHYVVIHKITKKEIVIADPACGIVRLTHGEFIGTEKPRKNHMKYEWSGHLLFFEPEESFQRTRDYPSIYIQFVHEIFKQKNYLFLLGILSLLCTAIGMLPALYYKELMDRILPEKLEAAFTYYTMGLLILTVGRIVLEILQTVIVLRLSKRLDEERLLECYQKMFNLPIRYFHTRQRGDIVARLQDTFKIREGIISCAMIIVVDGLMVILGAILLYQQSHRMFLVTVLIMIGYVVVMLVFDKSFERLNRRYMQSNAKFLSFLYDIIAGAQEIKVFQIKKRMEKKYRKGMDELIHNANQLTFQYEVQEAFKQLLELGGSILILWLGGLNCMHGYMSLGSVVVYYMLFTYFFEPVQSLAALQKIVHSSSVALERIQELFIIEPEEEDEVTDKEFDSKAENRRLQGTITFENVSFQYGMRKQILKSLNFQIQKGQKAAFVGESGSGKTTVLRLIMGLYKPVEGNVLIDGEKEINLNRLRRSIAYVSQETYLFGGSIYDNILIGNENATKEQVMEAARLARADEFIQELPMQYQTILGENGVNLSGGQKQRIAIARAILRKPDILLFDEGTSNLDAVSASAIHQMLNVQFSGVTRIMIAHKLENVKDCDQIFVMHKGEIVEQGTHEELKKHGKIYQGLLEQSFSINS